MKGVMRNQVKSSMIVKSSLRQVFYYLFEFSLEEFDLSELHGFEQFHNPLKVIFKHCIFIRSQESSFIQPLGGRFNVIDSIRVFSEYRYVVPVSPSEKHASIYGLGSILLLQKEFYL
jgi:hypothetical protein